MRNRDVAILAVVALGLVAGCKPKAPLRGSVSAVVAGRHVIASVEGSGAFIHTNGNTATVRFRGHKVEIEKERVVVNSLDTDNISSNVTMVDIAVTKDGDVRISGDGAKVMMTKLRK